MDVLSTAQRVRDSRRATVVAVTCVLLAQIPIALVFQGISIFGETLVGVVSAWFLGAIVWTLYAAVHLLAPVGDIVKHPDRQSWGPFQTVNIYTHVSVRQLGIRLLHGILGFGIVLTGVILLIHRTWLLVFPITVGIVAVLLMSLHVGIKEPSEEIKEHL